MQADVIVILKHQTVRSRRASRQARTKLSLLVIVLKHIVSQPDKQRCTKSVLLLFTAHLFDIR